MKHQGVVRIGSADPSGVPAGSSPVPGLEQSRSSDCAEERAAMIARMDEHYEAVLATPGLTPFVWMMSPKALAIASLNGEKPISYRGLSIEEHDEWSWGWMLRCVDGQFFDPSIEYTQGTDHA